MSFLEKFKSHHKSPAELTPEERKAQADRLMSLAVDLVGTLREAGVDPKIIQKYQDEQHEIAETRRRASVNSRILDIRLD